MLRAAVGSQGAQGAGVAAGMEVTSLTVVLRGVIGLKACQGQCRRGGGLRDPPPHEQPGAQMVFENLLLHDKTYSPSRQSTGGIYGKRCRLELGEGLN